MTQFALGKRALGICDTCGFEWPLKKLQFQIVAGKVTRLRHCPECLDIDNPQLQLGRVRVMDPQALWQPRPDPALQQIRGEAAWGPVGGSSLTMICSPQLYSGTSPASTQNNPFILDFSYLDGPFELQ